MTKSKERKCLNGKHYSKISDKSNVIRVLTNIEPNYFDKLTLLYISICIEIQSP